MHASLDPGTVMLLQVWHRAGDTSSELTWYSKRAALAAIYSATELYILTGVPSTRTRPMLACRFVLAPFCPLMVRPAPSVDEC